MALQWLNVLRKCLTALLFYIVGSRNDYQTFDMLGAVFVCFLYCLWKSGVLGCFSHTHPPESSYADNFVFVAGILASLYDFLLEVRRCVNLYTTLSFICKLYVISVLLGFPIPPAILLSSDSGPFYSSEAFAAYAFFLVAFSQWFI